MDSKRDEKTILLTGATGYVGGRLLQKLEKENLPVRCLVRQPENLIPRIKPGIEVVQGDVLDIESLQRNFKGVHAAFYLIHSLAVADGFEGEEYEGALNFATVAAQNNVRRIIYLSGLGAGNDLSPHLKSRHRVGQILKDSGVPTVEFRAGIIIGSGSFSFEMIRALVDRLPVMVTPRWAKTLTQPIAIEDVIEYLYNAIDLSLEHNDIYEIGCPDPVSYKDLMREYGRQRGLKRVMIQVPVLTPRLSSLWLGLVTPIHARIGRKLVEGLRNETIIHDDKVLDVLPIRPRSYQQAIQRALRKEDQEIAQTRWSDAIYSKGSTRTWGG